MPALINRGGDEHVRPRGPLYSNLMDSSLFLSLTSPTVEMYCPPRKRARVTAPFFFRGEEEAFAQQKHQSCSIDALPDECLFEVLRRLPGSRERCISACVSKRWLMLLSSIRASDVSVLSSKGVDESFNSSKRSLPDLNSVEAGDWEEEGARGEHFAKCFIAKDATDIRLAAMAVSAAGHRRLGKLVIRGSHPTRGVTDLGLSTMARVCPTLQALSMWSVPLVTDAGLSELASECPMLENLELCHCPLISDKGLIAVAEKCPNLTSLTIEFCSKIGDEGLRAIGRCCPKLQSIVIKDCLLVGDNGIAGLMSPESSSLKKIKLVNLGISDLSLAVIGHYGKSVTELAVTGLQNIGERGFWVMGNSLGLKKLTSLFINACRGFTDLALEAIVNCCPNLKQLCLSRCCDLSDAGLKDLVAAARALESLRLKECNQITLVGVLGGLVNCPYNFRDLALVKCLGIRDISSCPSPLPSCLSLRFLAVRDCPGFTSSSLAMVGKMCPNLQKIDLSGLGGVTDAGILPLIENSDFGLSKVKLSDCANLTDTSISALVKAHGDTLELLHVDGCKMITDESLLAIADSCSMLEELNMSKCSITDYGVAVLASARKLNLRVVSLSGCSKVTQKSLPFLGNMGWSLVRLNLDNCSLISSHGIGWLREKLVQCALLS